MDDTDLLARVSIFSHMKVSDLVRITSQSRHCHYREGETIIREGERDASIHIIIDGEVDVIKNYGNKNERLLRNLKPLSYFGEMALLGDLVRTASVIAKTKTHTLCIERLNLYQEIEQYPKLAFELLQMLTERILAIEKSLKKSMDGLVPICANCKKIRESDNTWTSIEAYISDRSDSEFSHSICPACAKALYPDLDTDP